MQVIIDQRLALQERSGTVMARGGEIWTYGNESRKLVRYTELPNRELILAAALPSISAEDPALAWDGNQLLMAERSQKKIFRVNPISGQKTLVMDPDSLNFGDHGTALLITDSLIGDIAWFAGLLYLALQAGYSSTIYGIDLRKKKVVSARPAPGPKPWGLDFDPVDGSMYVVDTRNRELRRFSSGGQVDVAKLPPKWVEPRGLSFEEDRKLWSTDWTTGDVLYLKVEG